MNNQIKLVAIDVDGTLLNSAHQLTPKVIAAINAAKNHGVKIVICTGRPKTGVITLLDELGLNNSNDEYLICFGGAVAMTTANKILFEKGITYADFCELELLARKKNLHFQAESLNRIYTCNQDIGEYTLFEANLVNLPVSYRTPEQLKHVALIKAMYVEEPALLDEAISDRRDFLALTNLEFTKTAPAYFEAYQKGVNKGAALAHLGSQLGILASEMLVIGDEENDVSMFAFAQNKAAMGNAIEKLKQQATMIVKDNDHDGVCDALIKFGVIDANEVN